MSEHQASSPSAHWIALSIGNTHGQWGYFEGQNLTHTWTSETKILGTQPSRQGWQHWCEKSPALQWHHQQGRSPFPPLCLAGVVETARQQWLSYPQVTPLTLANIPMDGLYDGLGIDRALVLFGAGHHYGWPVLVIDAGTALTFSGGNDRGFIGGAIAPGLGLQLTMLHHNTAALPHINQAETLPTRWGQNTADAILSGVIFNSLSGIEGFSRDWISRYPQSSVILTGGDGARLLRLLQQYQPLKDYEAPKYQFDPYLILKGIARCQLNG